MDDAEATNLLPSTAFAEGPIRAPHRSELRPADGSYGSHLAVPLTSGGGALSDVKPKKHDQELTLGSKVGLLQESGHTSRWPRGAECSPYADVTNWGPGTW